MFASSTAGGVGLNLQTASVALVIDQWWSEMTKRQAIGRIWRIGQTKQCIVEHFKYIGSFDDGVEVYHASKQQSNVKFTSEYGASDVVSFDCTVAARLTEEICRRRQLLDEASRAATVSRILKPERAAREAGSSRSEKAILQERRVERATIRFG